MVFVAILIWQAALGATGSLRRSMSAEPDWQSQEEYFTGGSRGGAGPHAWRLTYLFEAGGHLYHGAASRHWSRTTLNSSHVCYDPGNPDDNMLEPGGFRCGQFAPLDVGN